MKKFKLLLLSLVFSVGVFTSCTDNNDIDNLPDVQESETVQSVIAELRTMYNDDGTVISNDHPTGNIVFDFCFEFVYPVTLIYNTGATVEVNSMEELITLLINSTDELYIVGIEFPFNVEVYNPDTNEVEIVTINNEIEFATLLESCVFNDCNCTDEFDPVCVDIEENGQTFTITFPNSCWAECEGFTADQYYTCEINDDCNCTDEYEPVCVELPTGEVIEFNNDCLALCAGFTPNDFVDCDSDNDCNCSDEYEPVCVEVDGAIIEFQNYCYAECEGYTQQDMVDCDNDDDDDCDISNLSVTIGECNDDGTYSITIDFDYDGTAQNEFNLYLRDDVLLGSFPLIALPLTIDNFELSGYDEDFIKVCLDNTNSDDGCCEEAEWYPPNCGNDGDCSISNLEVTVGECNPVGSYLLTIDFDYENTNGQQYFDLYLRNDVLLGYYSLAELPLTIYDFELSGYDNDFIKVCINDNSDCCQEIEWDAPDCDGNDFCYEFVFPVSLYLNGTTVTANSNEEVDEYLDLGYDLMYPIDIIYNNETITVQQGLLEGAYGERCDD